MIYHHLQFLLFKFINKKLNIILLILKRIQIKKGHITKVGDNINSINHIIICINISSNYINKLGGNLGVIKWIHKIIIKTRLLIRILGHNSSNRITLENLKCVNFVVSGTKLQIIFIKAQVKHNNEVGLILKIPMQRELFL